MKRYKIGSVKFGGYYTKEDPEGAWVNYEDVADLVSANEVTDEMIEAGAKRKYIIDGGKAIDWGREPMSIQAIIRTEAGSIIEAALKAKNT